MLIVPSFQKRLIVEQFQGNYLKRKRNWSAPGPDKLANYSWKNAEISYQGVTRCFKSISKVDFNYPAWLTGGKTSLIPKEGNFTNDNQRPITCLNTIYKWFTSCMLRPMDEPLNRHELMEKQQRGATERCRGTTDNLHIDRMVTQDCHRDRRNLSKAWIDVTKAYDSVAFQYGYEW